MRFLGGKSRNSLTSPSGFLSLILQNEIHSASCVPIVWPRLTCGVLMARKNGQILGRDMRIWLVRLGYRPVCARLQLELL